MLISVPEGQKWKIFEFDGKYLKLGCSYRLAVGDMFCLAFFWASAEVKFCFYDKNWARNGNFSGGNEKIELMSLPISPIFSPIDLHKGQPLAKFGPNNSIWQEIRGLFFACNLKKVFVY